MFSCNNTEDYYNYSSSPNINRESKRIIFLDIDGVLNNHKTLFDSPYCGIQRENVIWFNILIQQTEADVVLSSSWRYLILSQEMTLKGFNYLLVTHGVKCDLIGHTCSDNLEPTREKQILKWIKDNQYTKNYVVLDDLNLKLENFVRINGSIGLTESDIKKAIHILN